MLNPNLAGKFDDLVTQLTREDLTALFDQRMPIRVIKRRGGEMTARRLP